MNQKLRLRLQQINLLKIHLAAQLLLEKNLQKHQEKFKQKRLLMKLRFLFKKRLKLKLKKRHHQLVSENNDLLSRLGLFSSSQITHEDSVLLTQARRMTI
jgi:hypothetical protein